MINFVFRKDIPGVLIKLCVTEYSPADWRLFIDSSKRSLKCALLHITNVYGSITIGHSTTLKEKYDAIKVYIAAYQIQKPLVGDTCRFKDGELLA